MKQKGKLAICFVERTSFFQGELYAQGKVHSTITSIGVHSESIDGMTESVILSVM